MHESAPLLTEVETVTVKGLELGRALVLNTAFTGGFDVGHPFVVIESKIFSQLNLLGSGSRLRIPGCYGPSSDPLQ